MTQRNPHPFEPQDDDALSQLTNISIKGLRLSKDFSEETHCFQATVYIDGKRAFVAHNEGHGGANYYAPHGVSKNSDAKRLAFKNSMAEARKEAACYIEAKGEDYNWAVERFADNDELIDWVITDLINEIELLKEMRKHLKIKVVAYNTRTRKFDQWRTTPVESNIDPLKKVFEKMPYVWLNELSESEALKYWRNAK
tara:strand:- start:257 stop:847 length:591 start_codon:yes stop_codon:yes gene_type:complete